MSAGRSPDLFDYVNAAEAREQGHEAAESCAAKAESRGWDSEAAAAFVLTYLRRHGPTSGEAVVTAASVEHPAHDARAFGAVFARLARSGAIEAVGYAPRTKGHGTAGTRIWKAK